MSVYATHGQVQLRDCVLRHVSTYGLTSLVVPSSLKSHSTTNSTDKEIWDAAYAEEYEGLASLPT
jgi:hypothetical protein